MTSLKIVLAKMKNDAYSLRDMGTRFEHLIKSYLLSDPKYSGVVETVWIWEDFPFRQSLGSLTDTGIDLVVKTFEDEFWAVQCKFYDYNRQIGKQDIDSFLSTSSKNFIDESEITRQFSLRLLITTSSVWGSIAEQTIVGQNPPVIRVSLHDLEESGINWEKIYKGEIGEEVRAPKYTLRPHQQEAFDKSIVHFNSNDRGKMIMACGTGKTFTALRIAEAMSEKNGIILFMVPSIALLGQTLNEWTKNASKLISPILICSDPKVNKDSSKVGLDDLFTSTVDLALPSSTNVEVIKNRIIREKLTNKDGMVVVFSTYQSIDVVSEVQSSLINDSSEFVFDLTICDEAHRTTGVTLEGNDESHFVKVHDDKFIKSKKRLYMTATPRLYTEDSKAKAEESNALLCSMDDENIYGEEFHRIGFGEAVERDLLSDYKVLVLTVNELDIPISIQKMLSNEFAEIESDDLSKIVGSINALSKKILGDEGVLEFVDPAPMMRSVAFTNTIYNSKQITELFNSASRNYFELLNEDDESIVEVSSKHIDGSMSALERNRLMSWLKDEDKENKNESRILTNVRCLSEGVDVPSLDAILFLSARSSQVDVVQSVGRVMRKSPGKKYGYIIIPIVVPYDVDANTALDNNQRFKVVWSVLNALRAHDDRFNAQVNKIDLNKKKPDNILIGQISRISNEDQNLDEIEKGVQQTLDFDEFKQAMYAKIVKKVGNRVYWETWASDVAQIAIKHVETISKLIEDQENKYYLHFSNFLNNLQIMINPNITSEEAIEMISQHMITKPVFDALFEDSSFVKSNPISRVLESLISNFDLDYMTSNDKKLQGFYDNVRMRAAGIDNYDGKQKIILELYERFFKVALPKQTEKLGIVYTPVEIVDFMINSAEVILNQEFNTSISERNVHVLDPFSGTGTFLVRMIQSELISPKDLLYKYNNEFHGNEIVLLAYYIALINIEQALVDRTNTENYIPFGGLVLTDTFQMTEDSYESENREFFEMFSDNNHRVQDQLSNEIRLIIGNPPYSIGQKNINDNNKNQKYKKLDNSIKETYSLMSNAQQNKGLYDSYVRAFRWASNRITDNGVICFVTNGSYIDSIGFDGFRATLLSDFNSIYVINLRGNARTRGEVWEKEGGKIFGQGSRTQIAITILVKNKNKSKDGFVKYFELEDYLSREDKLQFIKNKESIRGLDWKFIIPNGSNDWIAQRNQSFSKYIPLGDKKNKVEFSYFEDSYSTGIVTGRNSWLYNSSRAKLIEIVKRFIDFYNDEINRCRIEIEKNNSIDFKQIVNRDSKKINWTESLLRNGEKYKYKKFDESKIILSSFRPFYNQWFYFDSDLVERPSNWLSIIDYLNPNFRNLIISVSGTANKNGFSTLISNKIQDFNFNTTAQAFPLYINQRKLSKNLFDDIELGSLKYGITDSILEEFKNSVSDLIDKESIFYYVYGVLHSEEYRKEFENNLQKELPRIPICRNFDTLSDIGRKLADLHNGFEDFEMYEGCGIVVIKENYEVHKMKLDEKNQTLIYNDYITISKIPSEAFDYKIAGRSALAWVVDRYKITVDKDSGILNDPNLYKGGKFIFDLIFKIINLSLETVKLVNSIPSLDIIE